MDKKQLLCLLVLLLFFFFHLCNSVIAKPLFLFLKHPFLNTYQEMTTICKSEDKGWCFDYVAGQQLTVAKLAGAVAILIAIFYGARVASGSLFAILQSAGDVVFGWPKQLAITLIFG